jgi:hypothetical protein
LLREAIGCCIAIDLNKAHWQIFREATSVWWKSTVFTNATLLNQSWRVARSSMRVKLLPLEGETHVLAESKERICKERSIRHRRQRRYLQTLEEIRSRIKPLKGGQLHQALGGAKKRRAGMRAMSKCA